MMASVEERSQLLYNTLLFAKLYDPQYEGRICDEVKECLSQGADINAADHNNSCNTMLHEAVTQKSKSLVSFLLDYGAKSDIINKYGLTAFELAKQLNCADDIIQLFENRLLHDEFLSRDSVEIKSFSDGYIQSILSANPKQSVISFDISGRDSHILLNEGFYKTIEMYENLIVVDVYTSEETPINDSVVLGYLKYIKNPIIIQCRSPSTTKVYFKEFQRDPGFINLNSNPTNAQQDLLAKVEDKESFGIRLILECFLSNEFGKFSDEMCKSLFSIYLSDNSLTLLSRAVKHNHLLAVRFLLLYKTQSLSLHNSMHTISREMLAALLMVEFPIPRGKINLRSDVYSHFRRCKNDLFRDAAYNGRQDLMVFLLQCINDIDCKVLIRRLLKRKRYIIALAMIKADAPYPDDFISSDINVRIQGGQEFVDLFRKRNQLHDLIVRSTLENVKEHLGKLCNSKLYLNGKNDSAVATALRNKKFDIYCYLWSQGVCFKDDEEKKLIHELDSV